MKFKLESSIAIKSTSNFTKVFIAIIIAIRFDRYEELILREHLTGRSFELCNF